MTDQIDIRPTTGADLPAIDALLRESYPVLLKPHYAPSVLVTALPLISRAQPALLQAGTYFMAEDGQGRALAAGGWTHSAPQGGVGPRDMGHIRHVVTHPQATRRGIATLLLQKTLCSAFKAGMTRLQCQSTLTAVPFYKTLGFRALGEIEITLRPGIVFPALQMERSL